MRFSSGFLKIALKVTFFPVSLAGLAFLQQSRLNLLLSPDAANLETFAERQEEEQAAALEVMSVLPSFGFDNLLADWVFLQFLQYFGNEEHRLITGYMLSGDFFDIIIDRDPYAYDPYIFLSTSMSIFAAQPQRAIDLQEEGLQFLTPELPPRSYFIWRSKGLDELLYLGDSEAASVSHFIAAEWAAQSPYPGAQEEDQYSLRQTARFYATDPDSVEAQLNAWSQVIASAPDEKTRAVVARKIEDLGAEIVQNDEGQYVIRRIRPEETEPSADNNGNDEAN